MEEGTQWVSIEQMEMFQEVEWLCDRIWALVIRWDMFSKDTVGKQLVRAVDSIGANLVEGDGRYHFREKLNFCYIARGSCRETGYWLKRAVRRNLIAEDEIAQLAGKLAAVARWLNTLIGERRRWAAQVREQPAYYDTECAVWAERDPDPEPGSDLTTGTDRQPSV